MTDLQCSKCQRQCIFKARPDGEELFGALCDSCNLVSCKHCAGIGTTEADAVALGQRNIFFFCADCRRYANDLSKLRKAASNLDKAKVEIKLKNTEIKKLDSEITNLKAELSKLDLKIRDEDTEIRQQVQASEEEVKKLSLELKKSKAVILHQSNLKEVSDNDLLHLNKVIADLNQLLTSETELETCQNKL